MPMSLQDEIGAWTAAMGSMLVEIAVNLHFYFKFSNPEVEKPVCLCAITFVFMAINFPDGITKDVEKEEDPPAAEPAAKKKKR